MTAETIASELACCAWLRRQLGAMNLNGITVVARYRFGARVFVVRFRAVDPTAWSQLEEKLPQMTPFASSAELAINHCPGCGASLSDLAIEKEDLFDALVPFVVD